ncbi:heavy-metal-associated domain-containing protein [Myxococcota bacterium]|nr:heavy-metal-associated domain-containing protein [Myxococcota bacterium]
MTRLIFAAALLFASAPAFACAGGKCGDECSKATKTETAKTETPAATPAKVEGEKVVLNVTGMSCVSCSNKVTASLKAVDGVKSATVDVATGKAELVIDNKKTNADALAKVVTDSGFKTTVSTQ